MKKSGEVWEETLLDFFVIEKYILMAEKQHVQSVSMYYDLYA